MPSAPQIRTSSTRGMDRSGRPATNTSLKPMSTSSGATPNALAARSTSRARTASAACFTALPVMYRARVAVVVPASGVTAESLL